MLFNYPLVLSGIALGLVLIVFVGIPSVAAGSGRQTLLQRDVPDHYRGRVFAALGTTSATLMLVATLMAGIVGETVGPIAMLNVQGAAYIVSGVVVLVLLAPAPARAARGSTAGEARGSSLERRKLRLGLLGQEAPRPGAARVGDQAVGSDDDEALGPGGEGDAAALSISSSRSGIVR